MSLREGDARGAEVELGQDRFETSHVRPSTWKTNARRLGNVANEPSSRLADRIPTSGLPKTPIAGERLGRFQLVSAVAKGGMGTIWAAREPPAGPVVAVKTLHSEGAHDTSLRNMFLDEARIAMACRHPNVCRVIEVGEDQGTLFLAMEWIDGDALQNVLVHGAREGIADPLPEAIALRIVRRVCDALHEAHELKDTSGQPLGLVHRDVSPHNVLLATDGMVKLIDFGIAKTRRRISQTTRSGVVKGKLRYMAPEQLDGGDVDRRADVWSLGAVLFLLASGEELFGDSSEAEVVRTLVMRDPLPRPVVAFSRPIGKIVDRALSFEPHERFQDTLAMREAIERALDAMGEPLSDAHDREVLAAFARTRVGARVSSRKLVVDHAVTEIDALPPHAERSRGRVVSLAFAASVVALCGLVGLAFGRSQSGVRPDTAPSMNVVSVVGPGPELAAPLAPPVQYEIVDAPTPSPALASSSAKRPTKALHGKTKPTKAGSEFDHHD